MQSLGVNVAFQFPDLPPVCAALPADVIDCENERQLGIALYRSLTSEQRAAVDAVMSHVKDLFDGIWRRPRCVFISGEGGTGMFRFGHSA